MNVVIIGAGPAGLFAARELAKNPKTSITVVDKTNRVGGSGLRSDGKLNFTYKEIGVDDLTKIVSEFTARDIIKVMMKFFYEHNIHILTPEHSSIMAFRELCKDYDLEYIYADQAHIGSDRLDGIMKQFHRELVEMGVNFFLNNKVIRVEHDYVRMMKMRTNVSGDDSTWQLPYDKLIIAVGRTGSLEFKSLYDELGIEYSYSPIDIGVRVEVPSFGTKRIVEDLGLWDPKIIGYTSRQNKVRTFCTCPYGYLRTENYGEFNGSHLIGVNGYSDADRRSDNSNFAFMNTVNLTEPFEDTTLLGQIIVQKVNLMGGGKPIVQRYVDFIKGRRTNKEKMKELPFKSTLSPDLFTPGDITFAYSGKIVDNLREGLDRLSHIIEMPPKSTLLFAPEVKFYARKIKFEEGFRTIHENIYIVGDGSGVSRGIVGAGATGIIAAKNINE